MPLDKAVGIHRYAVQPADEVLNFTSTLQNEPTS